MRILSVGLTVAVMLACGCDCGQKTNKRFPQLEVLDAVGNERSSVDFGLVQVHTPGTQLVRLRNSGNQPLTLSTTQFSKPKFGTSTTFPTTLEVNAELLWALTFTPDQLGLHETGTVVLTSDDPARPSVTLELTGMGVSAVAVVQPDVIDFGQVYVNEVKDLVVTLTNTGTNDLVVNDAKVPAGVTGDLSLLKTSLKAGSSASTTLTFAPTMKTTLAGGALELDLGSALGTLSVPVKGEGIQAVPRLCVRFDGATTEVCTDAVTTFLPVAFGSLCDATIFVPDGGPSPCVALDGGVVPYARTATIQVRNEGNTPFTYTAQFNSKAGVGCDAGSTVDFEFSNAPDSGVTQWNLGTTRVPMAVTEPMPWVSPTISLTYRARSACREDGADSARVVLTRQEPAGTNRPPTSLVLNFTGQSQLPHGVPQELSMSGSVPLSADFTGVGNVGDARLELKSLAFYQAAYLPDGGRGTGPDFDAGLCDALAGGDCSVFSWADGGPNFPIELPAAALSSMPTSRVLGRVLFDVAADGGSLVLNREYLVYAVITTSDPYGSPILSKVRATPR